MSSNDKVIDYEQLRKKVERIIGENKGENIKNGDADLVRLIKELEIYQVELELQNQELLQAAKDLEIARNEWFELFDTAPVGFIIMNESGMIERCNRLAGRLFSGRQYSMSGRYFLSRVHPDDREIYFHLIRSLKGPGSTLSRELRLVQENGQIVHVHIEASALRDSDGEFSQCRLALVDITDRKVWEKSLEEVRYELEDRVRERTAELEVRNRQLAWLTSELTLAEQKERKRLAEVLHDNLQQLLAGARLHLEILSGEAGVEDKPAYKSAYNLMTESIEVSRSLSSELSPPVLYQKGLPEALRWLARWMATTHRLDVDLNFPDDFPIVREETRVLLFYSVRELLFNVVKHAETSNAQVVMQEKNGRIGIMVSDKGRGGNPGCLTMDGRPAVGFGLFAIRERLELLGGNLEVVCAPGLGTTATISLPVEPKIYARPEQPLMILDESREVIEHTSKPTASSGKIRVMLVDDHSVMRKGLLSLLSAHADIEIAGEAADGEDAVEQARHIQPDIILMDINMPRMNGVEATRRIHSEMPDIRIYGLSMYDAEDQAHAMTEAGAAGYLSKSGSTESLLAAIRGEQ